MTDEQMPRRAATVGALRPVQSLSHTPAMGGTRLLAAGTRLGHYRVEAFLARGSSGEVYRARDERLERMVAIKVMPPALGEDDRLRARFLAEARAAASLDHANVLPVYDAGDEEGTLWIAMRLADGPDLRELLRQTGPLPPTRVCLLLTGIAAALDAAAARGILHRDVKPANILLSGRSGEGSAEHAYLADFGLATLAHERGLTRTGELLGTVDYVSPEQARGEPLDARSDAWSLAAVLYECVTGLPPFRRATELAALTARLEAPAAPASSIRPDLPAGLDAVLARGLARDPAARYPSAGALLAAATDAVRGAQLRGLLFADLRGYTAFSDREGDARAAALVGRYRETVRAVLARSSGAEVRTEGDSFYVVFPSSSAAIRAGLAIVAAADAATAADPSLPLRPGIGVHAGEPLAAPEGPIGSAVNTAARLCSLAAAGEVLVSATARELASGSHDLAFTARGSHPVKGLTAPLEAWAARQVVPGTGGDEPAAPVPSPARRLARRRVALALVPALVILGALSWAGTAAHPSTSPPASSMAAGAVVPSASSGASTRATPPTTAPVPTASASPGLFPNAVEASILSTLPSTLTRTCVRGGTADDAALAGFVGEVRPQPNQARGGAPVPATSVTPSALGGVTCHPAAGASRLYAMAPQSNPLEGNLVTGDGDVYLGYLVSVRRLPFGSCETDSKAYELWSGPGGGGTLACISQYDGRPWIYFSFNKGRYLGFATRDDSNYAGLYQWWAQLKTFLP
jgi:class 3 adenylate cyclase